MGIRLLMLLLLVSVGSVSAQFKADVTITDLDNQAQVARMSSGLSKVIDEVNRAYTANAAPRNPDKSLITEGAFANILSLWEVSAFRVTQTQLILSGLHLMRGGYQIRFIPVFFKEESEDGRERELGFNFDASGRLIECFLCLESNSFKFPAFRGDSVKVMTRKEVILDFIEKFRTAYNIKDLSTIEQVYSDDALIITGRVIKSYPAARREKDGNMPINLIPVEKVELMKQNKREYMNKLSRIFKSNAYMKVEFDSTEILQNEQRDDLFAVTLYQTWKTSTYGDEGWLFLLIDFKDENRPLIHVRSWYPGILNNQHLPRSTIMKTGTDVDISNY